MDSPRFHLSIISLLFVCSVTGCITTAIDKGSQTFHVKTEPPGATVWEEDGSGQKVVGQSPLNLSREYELKRETFNSNWWWLLGGSLVVGGAGEVVGFMETSEGSDDLMIAGFVVAGIGLATAIVTTILCIRGEMHDGTETGQVPVTIGAKLDGYTPSKISFTVPSDKKDINLLLHRTQSTVTPTPAVQPQASKISGLGPRREIVAVFDVHDATGRLDKKALVQLTMYLGTNLAGMDRFKIIPREQLRARLAEHKKGTHAQCYDESCQIELGRAVAAQKTLSTTLIRVGSKCAVTANLFDLKTETTDKGASVETGCSTDELLGAMKKIAEQMANWVKLP